MWRDGEGDLPPGWHFEWSEGRPYFISPSTGGTTWEDPREDYLVYEAEFVAAGMRGVDVREYGGLVGLLGSPLPPPPSRKAKERRVNREARAHLPHY